MASEESLIITSLLESRDKELTIHQISKSIKKSYAYTNKHVHAMIKKCMLKNKVIGPAILCSLDFRNEETIASLVYISMIKKARHNLTDKQHVLIEKYSGLGILVYYDQKLSLISDEKTKNIAINVLTTEKFLSNIKTYDFSKNIVLSGHELFFRLVSKVMQ